MNDDRLFIANTLRIAREDLTGARQLAATGNRNAIYLCEQAAEKVILAVLTSENILVRRDEHHQLGRQADKVPDDNPLKEVLQAMGDLTPYATTFRYTKPSGLIPEGPSMDVFNELSEKVESALNDVAARFGVDLDRKDTPAARSSPIR